MRRALILSGQLKNTLGSRYRAELLGDTRYLGWSENSEILASISDTLTGIVGSLGGQKVTVADMWPRPHPKGEEAQEVGTIADFDPNAFMQWLMT